MPRETRVTRGVPRSDVANPRSEESVISDVNAAVAWEPSVRRHAGDALLVLGLSQPPADTR